MQEPLLYMTSKGTDIRFPTDETDTYLCNKTSIALFTKAGWIGAMLKGCEDLDGSHFLDILEQPTTVSNMKKAEQEAEKILEERISPNRNIHSIKQNRKTIKELKLDRENGHIWEERIKVHIANPSSYVLTIVIEFRGIGLEALQIIGYEYNHQNKEVDGPIYKCIAFSDKRD